MAKRLQYYIGGGMAKRLQYYIGRGGSTETPKMYYVIYERPLMVKPEPHRKLSKVCIHSIYKTRSLSYFLRNLMRYFQLFHPVKSAWSALKKEACINLLKTPTFPASTSYNMLEQALHTTLVLS